MVKQKVSVEGIPPRYIPAVVVFSSFAGTASTVASQSTGWTQTKLGKGGKSGSTRNSERK